MARYHVNPETGDPGACRARKRCPWGDLERDHYPSREEAQRAYEERRRHEAPPPRQRREGVPESYPKEPLETVGPELARLRAWQDRWYENLSEGEQAALGRYSSPFFHEPLNRALRRGEPLTGEQEALRAALDSALAKAPPGEPEVLYRGLRDAEGWLKTLTPGAEGVLPGYTSTSTQVRAASLFFHEAEAAGAPVFLELQGGRGAPVDLGEREVLLPRNVRYRVEAVGPSVVAGVKVTAVRLTLL